MVPIFWNRKKSLFGSFHGASNDNNCRNLRQLQFVDLFGEWLLIIWGAPFTKWTHNPLNSDVPFRQQPEGVIKTSPPLRLVRECSGRIDRSVRNLYILQFLCHSSFYSSQEVSNKCRSYFISAARTSLWDIEKCLKKAFKHTFLDKDFEFYYFTCFLVCPTYS